ncbi:sn-glycerol-3-phosphate ABC transporter permease UgpE [Acidihalobacter ferrooxydans]|uniref:sn-glycerol-3-phosphate transport system permease protein UgpE n=1 Tax=Acidihalobacter ferrooxydans TaxID=1765967 RepID=A0A1P8UJT5_9GAMM|nr:sn-glycerol-3-phosphate ABC transporter permease UgpE [Acidihalobacter ferrooxydans]APZ44022.1 glycerol-3-phosphate transporter [Acidihalobacter ferrooxydans]
MNVRKAHAGRIVLLTLVAILVAVPLYIALVAASHSPRDLLGQFPLLPGHQLGHNFASALVKGLPGAPPVWLMLGNSLLMALGIAIGKLVISILSAYAVVYFRFPLRMTAFWLIFMTLMLPVEVRFFPTYQVTAGLHLLNSYGGLILPLIASATATFLFRQFFLTLPRELVDAARIDGAGPLRFFFDTALPLSRTNIAALFVLEFVYGWNQFLWPLLTTTHQRYATIVMGIQGMITASQSFALPQWNLIMATAILALTPPVLVVVLMQRWFIKGLTETEK